ncbi:unnamed protein product [Blepharisma stoltei]|uniref:Translation initiation factor eIF2B subunit gamma n=1 Tax=Blepharisma stoltei TaxID=1481888 RepID=A0AAU9JKW6_9CILI|nr:unnamed protein product [Blepharisma stoltei]
MAFQVVVLAGGRGQMLYPLANHTPKALLPIGNKPMLAYILETLDRSGEDFSRGILIATNDQYYTEISEFLSRYIQLNSNTYNVINVPEEFPGTLGTLRYLFSQKLITSDIMVVSCDLLVDHTIIPDFIKQFRIENSSFSMLLHNGTAANEEMQIFGVNENRVLTIFDWINISDSDGLVLPKRLLQKCPQIELRNDMISSYCYLFKKWLLNNILTSDDDKIEMMLDIKEDLVPFLLKKQFSSLFLHQFAYEEDSDEEEPGKIPIKTFKITFYLCPEDAFCRRVQLIKQYLETNMLKLRPLANDEKKKQEAKPIPMVLESTGNNARNILNNYYRAGKITNNIPPEMKSISNDSIIAENIVMGQKSSITKSIIGKDVTIGKGCKIVQSVIMDHVIIEDESNINNSIICSRAVVGSKSKVLNSQLAHGSRTEPGTMLKEEIRLG